MKKQTMPELYHGYILKVIEVGEIVSSRSIRHRLFDYNPNAEKGLTRVFNHTHMPAVEGIARILRHSPHFEREGDKWRRTE